MHVLCTSFIFLLTSFNVFGCHDVPASFARTNDPTGEAVVVQDAELKWPNGTPLLSPMSFAVPAPVQGQSKAHLTVVLGAVGTGKSGLLQALIGHLVGRRSQDEVSLMENWEKTCAKGEVLPTNREDSHLGLCVCVCMCVGGSKSISKLFQSPSGG